MWAAPEQLAGATVSTATDMFAFGIILWEICTNEQMISRLKRPIEVPQEAPPEVVDLIEKCHSYRLADRPTAGEAYDVLAATSSFKRRR